jgi:long-chain acyl-CoA synthetase
MSRPNRLVTNCSLLLSQWADDRDHRPALVSVEPSGEVRTDSWQSLAQDVSRLVSAIDKTGYRVGDRLVHSFGNTREGVLVALASLVARTIEVPVGPTDAARLSDFGSENDLERITSSVDGQPLFRDMLGELGNRTGSNEFPIDLRELVHRESLSGQHDAALILFTSGSTGAPRGVTLSRHNLFSNAKAKLVAVPQSRDDVRLTVLPIWHAYARTCDLMAWLLSGSTLVITSGWDGWQRLGSQCRPTLMNTVPSFANRLLQDGLDSLATSRLKWLGCGGAALTHDAFEAFRKQGIVVTQGYGLTEASPVVCSSTPQNARPGFVGCPVNGCEARIGEDGHLEVKGDGVMLGYWNDQAATEQKIRDGWLQTGDCVEVDPKSDQFRILGRIDDRFVLSNGYKFFPGPIERCLESIDAVSYAILIPNDRRVDLFVDFDPAISSWQDTLSQIEKCLLGFPRWQHPRRILSVPNPFESVPNAITKKGTLCRPVAIAACCEWSNGLDALALPLHRHGGQTLRGLRGRRQ